jgi:hypothetical protein
MSEETRAAAERDSAEPPPRSLTPQDRVLLLDMWQRSGLTACEFGALVGVNKRRSSNGRSGLIDPVRRVSQTNLAARRPAAG